MNKDLIQEIVDEKVNPLLKMHGGVCQVMDFKDNEISIKLHGKCAGCPGKQNTITRAIEPILKQELGIDLKVNLRK